ncbi:ATP-dependent (S)-NAD(P)H-hydrate dehydratase [Maioricimonas rarisocia]|uniref:ADP-dependent (S)-NAD(P)H-hydrate dehydratase n=1 Tax=Maioricimonas rarisocia TaxID=2528026 RepID=A0A517Z7U8_9PLAN|nr:NAD(P)H-hydrate dehydratase [Maioricimonas rarisocia]QDU38546.1 ATP-dependent (S)-NAD(P)H-hydrate dehydratase [Maioricimonas rarisocia]
MSIERVTELPFLPERSQDAHKGTFGRVLIAAGSRGMSGAACLAGRGALRGGAGLVYVACPPEILPTVAAAEPSYLTIPLVEDLQGHIAETSLDILRIRAVGMSALAIGPGWGKSQGLQSLTRDLYEQIRQPMVLDADALNALAGSFDQLGRPHAGRVLTPHPGEFARMIDSDISTVQDNREDMSVDFAHRHNVVLVLKGAGTVVTDGKRLTVNPTGNPGMATGGTGDVLTGLIAALLAQGLEPFAAAQLGAWLHGLAGDLAAAERSQPGLIASDLPEFLPGAWKQYFSIQG